MNGVQATGTYQLHSLIEGKTLIDIVAETLEIAQGSMTLVAMIDILLDAQFVEQQHTTDTKQNLLLETVLPVTAVEGMGDRLVEVGVHLVVGIQQIKLHATDIDTPYIGMNLIIGVRNINDQRVAVLVELTLNRQ